MRFGWPQAQRSGDRPGEEAIAAEHAGGVQYPRMGGTVLKRMLILAVALFTLVSAGTAAASSPHFKKGGSPVCQVSGTGTNSISTTCSASLSGLGGGDLVINLTVKGSAVYQCQNGGGQIAPGQNKVLVGPVTAPTTIPANQIKNGNVSFTTDPAVLTAPAKVTGAQAGCPNSNWTGVNPQLTLTSIDLTIAQAGAQLFDCSASDPFSDGSVALTC